MNDIFKKLQEIEDLRGRNDKKKVVEAQVCPRCPLPRRYCHTTNVVQNTHDNRQASPPLSKATPSKKGTRTVVPIWLSG